MLYVAQSVINGSAEAQFPNFLKIYHYAIYFNGISYELTRDSPFSVHAETTALEDFMKSRKIVKIVKVTKSVDDEQIRGYGEKWCEIHPVYSLTSTNCRRFVNDVCNDIFDCEFETQTEIVRRILLQTYLKAVVALGVVMVALGVIMVALGVILLSTPPFFLNLKYDIYLLLSTFNRNLREI